MSAPGDVKMSSGGSLRLRVLDVRCESVEPGLDRRQLLVAIRQAGPLTLDKLHVRRDAVFDPAHTAFDLDLELRRQGADECRAAEGALAAIDRTSDSAWPSLCSVCRTTWMWVVVGVTPSVRIRSPSNALISALLPALELAHDDEEEEIVELL